MAHFPHPHSAEPRQDSTVVLNMGRKTPRRMGAAVSARKWTERLVRFSRRSAPAHGHRGKPARPSRIQKCLVSTDRLDHTLSLNEQSSLLHGGGMGVTVGNGRTLERDVDAVLIESSMTRIPHTDHLVWWGDTCHGLGALTVFGSFALPRACNVLRFSSW